MIKFHHESLLLRRIPMSYLFGSTMLTTTVLLILSNLFMTFAWYAHLKNFAVLYMGETLRWNFLWAGLCLMGAVYFIFKG